MEQNDELQMAEFAVIKVQALFRMLLCRIELIKRLNLRFEKIYDLKRKKFYYYDKENDSSSWIKPKLLKNQDIAVISPTYNDVSAATIIQTRVRMALALMRVRLMYQSIVKSDIEEESGLKYYFNSITGNTMWDLPQFMSGRLDYARKTKRKAASVKSKRNITQSQNRKLNKSPSKVNTAETKDDNSGRLNTPTAMQDMNNGDADSDSDNSDNSEIAKERRRRNRKQPRSKAQRLVDEGEDRNTSNDQLITVSSSDDTTFALSLAGLGARYISSRIYDLTDLQALDLSCNKLNRISPNMQYFSCLQRLDLHHNRLITLPKELEELRSSLTYLDISHNAIADYPGRFYKLTSLRHLNLSYNLFEQIPVETGNLELLQELGQWEIGIGFLTQLEYLDASHCHITAWPPQLELLAKKLQYLDLSYNSLRSVPAVAAELTRLRTLRIAHNRINFLTYEIYDLKSLEVFDLSHNELKGLPAHINVDRLCMDRLTQLDLSHNQLPLLNDILGIFRKVRSLDVSYNMIKCFEGTALSKFTTLTELNASYNCLDSINEGIGCCKILKHLHLSHNQISEMPESMVNTAKIVTLDLSYNRLSELPGRVFAMFSDMTKLEVQHNSILSLPPLLYTLRHLQLFDISHNRISTISNAIGQLSNLTLLNLSYNNISSLPDEISSLSQLKSLELKSNKLSSLPSTLYKLTKLSRVTVSRNQFVSSPELLKILPKMISCNLSWNPRLQGHHISSNWLQSRRSADQSNNYKDQFWSIQTLQRRLYRAIEKLNLIGSTTMHIPPLIYHTDDTAKLNNNKKTSAISNNIGGTDEEYEDDGDDNDNNADVVAFDNYNAIIQRDEGGMALLDNNSSNRLSSAAALNKAATMAAQAKRLAKRNEKRRRQVRHVLRWHDIAVKQHFLRYATATVVQKFSGDSSSSSSVTGSINNAASVYSDSNDIIGNMPISSDNHHAFPKQQSSHHPSHRNSISSRSSHHHHHHHHREHNHKRLHNTAANNKISGGIDNENQQQIRNKERVEDENDSTGHLTVATNTNDGKLQYEYDIGSTAAQPSVDHMKRMQDIRTGAYLRTVLRQLDLHRGRGCSCSTTTTTTAGRGSTDALSAMAATAVDNTLPPGFSWMQVLTDIPSLYDDEEAHIANTIVSHDANHSASMINKADPMMSSSYPSATAMIDVFESMGSQLGLQYQLSIETFIDLAREIESLMMLNEMRFQWENHTIKSRRLAEQQQQLQQQQRIEEEDRQNNILEESCEDVAAHDVHNNTASSSSLSQLEQQETAMATTITVAVAAAAVDASAVAVDATTAVTETQQIKHTVKILPPAASTTIPTAPPTLSRLSSQKVILDAINDHSEDGLLARIDSIHKADLLPTTTTTDGNVAIILPSLTYTSYVMEGRLSDNHISNINSNDNDDNDVVISNSCTLEREELVKLFFECLVNLGRVLMMRCNALRDAIRVIEQRCSVPISCIDIAQRQGCDIIDVMEDVYEQFVKEVAARGEAGASGSKMTGGLMGEKQRKVNSLMNRMGIITSTKSLEEEEEDNEQQPVKSSDAIPSSSSSSSANRGPMSAGHENASDASVLSPPPLPPLISLVPPLLDTAKQRQLIISPIPIHPLGYACIRFLRGHQLLLLNWTAHVLEVASEILTRRGWDPQQPQRQKKKKYATATEQYQHLSASVAASSSVVVGVQWLSAGAARLARLRGQLYQSLQVYGKAVEEYTGLMRIGKGVQTSREVLIDLIKVHVAQGNYILAQQVVHDTIRTIHKRSFFESTSSTALHKSNITMMDIQQHLPDPMQLLRVDKELALLYRYIEACILQLEPQAIRKGGSLVVGNNNTSSSVTATAATTKPFSTSTNEREDHSAASANGIFSSLHSRMLNVQPNGLLTAPTQHNLQGRFFEHGPVAWATRLAAEAKKREAIQKEVEEYDSRIALKLRIEQAKKKAKDLLLDDVPTGIDYKSAQHPANNHKGKTK